MNAKQLSADIITYAAQCGFPVTNLKLQKTLYYLQGYYAKAYGESLFSDESNTGHMGLSFHPFILNTALSAQMQFLFRLPTSLFPATVLMRKKLLISVIDKCLSLTARELVGRTHRESPWMNTQPSDVIPFNAILHYFRDNDPLGLSA